MNSRRTLIGLVDPQPNSTVMIYDLHASETGALSILNDLYLQVRKFEDKSVKWIFVVSTPSYQETDNIIVRRFPWVKKNWGYRVYFEQVTTRSLISEFQPNQIFSLQNRGILYFHKRQLVYLHLFFGLTDYKFHIRTDGIKLWLYQKVVSKINFRTLRRVDLTIVQTQWMKQALVNKVGMDETKIWILPPDVTSNQIGSYVDSPVHRRRFFYPAAAFAYKNHFTMLKAIKYAQDRGLKEYEVIFTICPDENRYTKQLCAYVAKNHLSVTFVGKISREQVFHMYESNVLLFPSCIETFGLPLLEARLTGTPIIASDTSFSHEILDGYQKVWFFDEMDWKNFGEEIMMLQKF